MIYTDKHTETDQPEMKVGTENSSVETSAGITIKSKSRKSSSSSSGSDDSKKSKNKRGFGPRRIDMPDLILDKSDKGKSSCHVYVNLIWNKFARGRFYIIIHE